MSKRKRVLLALIPLLLFGLAVRAQVLAKQYKVLGLGPYSVGIVCLDGSLPHNELNGGLVIVNCPTKVAH